MTREQQKIVDGYHERVIALIFKRRRAMKYAVNPQLDFDTITAEIEKVENERRTYERNAKPQRQEEPKVEGRIPGEEAGNERREAETGIQPENEDVVS
jgi:hypothetical protein